MLIRYADIPEETVRHTRRQHHYQLLLFILNMLLNWAVLFVVLLPKKTTRAGSLLTKVAAAVSLGRWLDLYLTIPPATGRWNPHFGLSRQVAALASIVGLFVLVFARAFRNAPPVPMGDPLLTESLLFHN